MTHLLNIAWKSRAVPKKWQTKVMVPLFRKWDQSLCVNYRGTTLLSLPGKVYSKVLEGRDWLLVEPRIEEEQCKFCLGGGATA